MGLFKRIVNTATKDWKNANYQLKAVLKQKAIEEGEKVLPPKHPTDAKHFEKAVADKDLKQKIDHKDAGLIDNVNKINIKSTDPPGRRTSDKSFPTRESEHEHRNDKTWEHGFYEPSLDKMEKNRLMFREALELLRNRMEFELPGPRGGKRGFADEAFKKYNEHAAVERIDKERLENLWRYFRPFERREEQRVVQKRDLQELEDFIEGRSASFVPEVADIKLALSEANDNSHRSVLAKKLLQMNDKDRTEFLAAIQGKNIAEKKRLDKRLEEMKLLESELNSKEEEELKKKQEREDKDKN